MQLAVKKCDCLLVRNRRIRHEHFDGLHREYMPQPDGGGDASGTLSG